LGEKGVTLKIRRKTLYGPRYLGVKNMVKWDFGKSVSLGKRKDLGPTWEGRVTILDETPSSGNFG